MRVRGTGRPGTEGCGPSLHQRWVSRGSGCPAWGLWLLLTPLCTGLSRRPPRCLSATLAGNCQVSSPSRAHGLVSGVRALWPALPSSFLFSVTSKLVGRVAFLLSIPSPPGLVVVPP